ncbi:MAG: NfeD family protein [Solirubrobacteraceae bacterium]|jgi:membrane protein implicated in regulation of membrane protease activity
MSWVLWVVVAGAFTVGEMHTNGLYLAPFAAGAAIAAALALLGAGALLAVVAFLGTAVLSLGVLRPVAMRHRHTLPAIRTGAAALIGQEALVVERIANHEAVGTVKIGGEVWTARSFDDDRVIEPGERVEVVEIRGATALVLP